MRRLFASALLLGTVLSSPVFALDFCKPSKADPQMRSCAYTPDQRYRVVGVVGEPVNLTFANGETIKRIEFGSSAINEKGEPVPTWQGPKVGSGGQGMPPDAFKNNLPIWPLKEGHSWLVVITTTAKGEERPYQFDLVAKPTTVVLAHGGSEVSEDNDITAGLSFNYPADDKAAAIAAWQERHAHDLEQTAKDRLKTDVFYGAHRNWRYVAVGDKKYAALAPSQVSDNGFLTEMQWPGNIARPRIYLFDPKDPDHPTIAPTTVRDDGITVVQTTHEWFLLRLGDDPHQALLLHNLAWSPNRPDPKTGTTSSDVVREVISAK